MCRSRWRRDLVTMDLTQRVRLMRTWMKEGLDPLVKAWPGLSLEIGSMVYSSASTNNRIFRHIIKSSLILGPTQ